MSFLNLFGDITRTLQSDWPRIFWAITPKQEFCQTWVCHGKLRIKGNFALF